MDAPEAVTFLAGSPERLRLLTHLREQSGSPRDVADATDVSRRSVQRNLSEFADRGWVEKKNGVYELTTSGELVARTHTKYVETLGTISAYDSFYRHLPDADHAPDPGWLADATLVTATADQPQAPVNHYVKRLRARETETVRILAPVLSRLYHDAHAELVLSGVETELIMPPDRIETARSSNPLEFRLVSRAIDIYEHDGPIDFGLTLGDDWAFAGAYDDDGQLRALLEYDDPNFFDWAETLYQQYRNRSSPIR
ncbi:Predicted transcriptional regulator, contains HTH domain [Haladaptatus litoreus]|uniref:Predicted transcriptional regulator, contains HTH domain n=1 Tax=Haladaptatus litoreus TaxID=553468 RepID=A0A1N6YUA8_9EURY|nr:ArsR family transcriptional regulator [Haladaptatus litoreus]SIR18009.1 Predicted transcriptional regulator, contains HTH domain [Haladaptatus litoreus]